jgi:serine/threonine protein kinase
MREDVPSGATCDARTHAPGESKLASPPGYELLEEIGRGGMGVVYRARDIALDRDVAVKLLSKHYPADSPVSQRFLNEARITAQLQHPGIPAVHQVGTLPDGRPFLAMKLIKGRTLESMLRERADSSADRGRLLAVFEVVCQAVGYAHSHRVIHRDLKPANVMVGAFAEVQVMDWGLAKVLGEAPAKPASDVAATEVTRAWTEVSPTPEAGSYTQAGSLVGTPAFVAPEQAAGELEKVDERSDVFGLGALLAVILTGKPPYVGETAEAVRLGAVRGKLDDCFARLDGCGAEPELVALCKRCLAFEPADRPHDAGEVAARVAGLRSAAEERARTAERDKAAADARSEEQRRKRRWQYAAAGVVVLALASGVLGLGVYLREQERANAVLAAKNEVITQEVEEKEKARLLAERRLLQSIDAVSLFARDARVYCEDAMVPAESRQKLYEVLINQLEKNLDDKDGPFDEDMIRNKILMYQQIAQVNADLGGMDRLKKAREWDEKGLALTEQWLKAKPGDPAARSHRAAYVHLLGVSHQRAGDKAKADAMYKEALDLRRELWNNPEWRKQIDRFTPGKSYTNLGDSLDTYLLFDESLKLREEAYKAFGTFELLDAWSWTCWKAGFYDKVYAKKKEHLAKSVELSDQLHQLRPTNRSVLKRLAFVLRDLGELEFNHGNVAEAQKHYTKLVEVTKMLATASDLARQRQSYARAWYTVGTVEKKLGHDAEAKKHFERCRLIREELLRDYPSFDTYVHLEIDLLFAQVALGEHERAVKKADEIHEKYSTNNNILYRLTCIYSLSIPEVTQARQPLPLTSDDLALQASYRDKALASLEQSLKSGNKEFFNMRTDADLDPIRSDPRFQQIVAKYQTKKPGSN